MSHLKQSNGAALLLLSGWLLLIGSPFSQGAMASPSADNLRKARSHYRDAEYFAKQNLLDEAIFSIGKAIELDPDNASYHVRKCNFLFSQQDDDNQALKEIDRAIACARTPVVAYLGTKAAILERLHRLPEALDCCNKVLASKEYTATSQTPVVMKKAIAFILNLRASIEKKMHRPQDALNDLDQAIKLNPQVTDLHAHRSEINAQQKRWAQVIPDAEFSIKTHEVGAPYFRKRDSYLQLAEAYNNLKNIEKAKETYSAALKDYPDDRLTVSKAQKYFASIGDTKNASTLQKRLNSLDEDFVPFK